MTGKGKRITEISELGKHEQVYYGDELTCVRDLRAYWTQPIFEVVETKMPVCPFCGSIGEVIEDDRGMSRVICTAHCYAKWDVSREDAIARWSKRV